MEFPTSTFRHTIPQANGSSRKRTLHDIWEGLVKACEGNINRWPDFIHHAFFAVIVVTTRRCHWIFHHSTFYMVVDPVLPLDLLEADFTSYPDLFPTCHHQISSLYESSSSESYLTIIDKACRKHSIDHAWRTRQHSKQQFQRRLLARWIQAWRLSTRSEFPEEWRKKLDRGRRNHDIWDHSKFYDALKEDLTSWKRWTAQFHVAGVAGIRLLPYHTHEGIPIPIDDLHFGRTLNDSDVESWLGAVKIFSTGWISRNTLASIYSIEYNARLSYQWYKTPTNSSHGLELDALPYLSIINGTDAYLSNFFLIGHPALDVSTTFHVLRHQFQQNRQGTVFNSTAHLVHTPPSYPPMPRTNTDHQYIPFNPLNPPRRRPSPPYRLGEKEHFRDGNGGTRIHRKIVERSPGPSFALQFGKTARQIITRNKSSGRTSLILKKRDVCLRCFEGWGESGEVIVARNFFKLLKSCTPQWQHWRWNGRRRTGMDDDEEKETIISWRSHPIGSRCGRFPPCFDLNFSMTHFLWLHRRSSWLNSSNFWDKWLSQFVTVFSWYILLLPWMK